MLNHLKNWKNFPKDIPPIIFEFINPTRIIYCETQSEIPMTYFDLTSHCIVKCHIGFKNDELYQCLKNWIRTFYLESNNMIDEKDAVEILGECLVQIVEHFHYYSKENNTKELELLKPLTALFRKWNNKPLIKGIINCLLKKILYNKLDDILSDKKFLNVMNVIIDEKIQWDILINDIVKSSDLIPPHNEKFIGNWRKFLKGIFEAKRVSSKWLNTNSETWPVTKFG